VEATLGVQVAVRPIMMTSFAFILGYFRVISTGAGSEMRGRWEAVVQRMLGVTLWDFLTPVFFYVIQAFSDGVSLVKRQSNPGLHRA